MTQELSTDAKEVRKYQPHVDGLRAVAVLSVLFFHLGFSSFGGGFVGVDVFFVISGFLITGLLKTELDQTGTISFSGFYKRRIRRLLPALILVLALTAIASILLLAPSKLMRFGQILPYAVVGLSNFVFWVEADYFDISAQLKPLLHTWSLGVEEQFYLIWPSALLLAYKLGAKRFLPELMLIAGLVSLYLNSVFADGQVNSISAVLPFLDQYIANPKSTLYFLLPFRVFEFAIGALLVWAVSSSRSIPLLNDILLWGGLILIAYSALTFDDSMLFPSYAGLTPCLGTAMVIYAGGEARSGWVISNAIFVFIGKISYSLYLIHWPVIVFWLYVRNELSTVDQAMIIALSVAAAYLSYQFVETPFRKKSAKPASSAATLSALAGVFCVILLGLQLKQSRGWPERISSPANVKLAHSAEEFHRENYGGNGYPNLGESDSTHQNPAIVLMGDSHGRHFAEGLYQELLRPEKLELRVASGTSCLHLPGFTRTTTDRDWDRICPQAYETAIKAVNEAPQPPLVVISHAWNYQLARAGRLDNNSERQNASVDAQNIIEGLVELKKAIGDSELLVIGNVPTTNGVDLFDALTRPPLLAYLQSGNDNFLTANLSSEISGMNQALKQAAEDTGAFAFFNPVEVLCDEGRCKNIDTRQQSLIYSDTTHLSKYGSRLVIRGFLPELKALLATSKEPSMPAQLVQ